MDTLFARDVARGLSSNPKYVPSKYFYDETGSRLFREIMDLPEYYLTRAEHEIFSHNKQSLLNLFYKQSQPFNLIDFGAGDALKTKILIEHFLEKKVNFRYVPVDFSIDVITRLVSDVKMQFPTLQAEGIADDYFAAIEMLGQDKETRNIILFLGSNVGNLSHDDTIKFLSGLKDSMNDGDLLVTGFDLKKNPRLIMNAYNDSLGITREFNMNLLDRINRELGADFNRTKFDHYPLYDPIAGEARSYLVSLTSQSVYITKLDKSVNFFDGEPILTEISRKFSIEDIYELASGSGFHIMEYFFDSKRFFVDSVWRK